MHQWDQGHWWMSIESVNHAFPINRLNFEQVSGAGAGHRVHRYIEAAVPEVHSWKGNSICLPAAASLPKLGASSPAPAWATVKHFQRLCSWERDRPKEEHKLFSPLIFNWAVGNFKEECQPAWMCCMIMQHEERQDWKLTFSNGVNCMIRRKIWMMYGCRIFSGCLWQKTSSVWYWPHFSMMGYWSVLQPQKTKRPGSWQATRFQMRSPSQASLAESVQ